MDNLIIPNESLDIWLGLLKPYQRTTLNEFLKSVEPEAAAEKWLSTIGSPNIVGFGGALNDPKPFWEKFKSQFHKLICDETAFVEVKNKLRGQKNIVNVMTITVVSEALGSVLGISGTLLAPAVTIMLYAIGQVGLAAFCQT